MNASAAGYVFDWAARDPDRALFSRKADGRWLPMTAGEFAARVTAVAAGLVAAGIRAGDRVALMSSASLDWAVCDFAIWAAGAVTVPVHETSSAEQVRWVLPDSGAVAVFAENAQRARVIRSGVTDQALVEVLTGFRDHWPWHRYPRSALIALGPWRWRDAVR